MRKAKWAWRSNRWLQGWGSQRAGALGQVTRSFRRGSLCSSGLSGCLCKCSRFAPCPCPFINTSYPPSFSLTPILRLFGRKLAYLASSPRPAPRRGGEDGAASALEERFLCSPSSSVSCVTESLRKRNGAHHILLNHSALRCTFSSQKTGWIPKIWQAVFIAPLYKVTKDSSYCLLTPSSYPPTLQGNAMQLEGRGEESSI